jgi:hypothetical protein
MDDGSRAVECAPDCVRVADVADVELDVVGEIVGASPVRVDLRRQVVECADVIPVREQLIGEVRADEARTTRDQNELRRFLAQPAVVTSSASPRPAAVRSTSALSVRSQVKSGSSRPKWPYAAVFT